MNVVAAELFICLTLQAEGCTLELWNAHKDLLRENFSTLVKQVRAQQRRPEEPRLAAGGHQASNDGGLTADLRFAVV